jgi:hypothetical protein
MLGNHYWRKAEFGVNYKIQMTSSFFPNNQLKQNRSNLRINLEKEKMVIPATNIRDNIVNT